MKNLALLAIFTALTFLSCQKKTESERLKDLVKERRELNKNIAMLQKKIGVKKAAGAPSPVYTEEVIYRNFSKYITVQAKVEANNDVMATPQASGVVKQVYVRNGQYVKKGQTIAILDDNVINQQISEANQQIKFLKDIYDKQKTLWNQNIGTEVQLLTAKNNYLSAVKRKNIALSQKALYRVSAPISGVVDAVDMRIGELASPGSPRGIRIVNDRDLKVTAKIGEGNLALVNKGDNVLIILPDLGDTLTGRISYVSKTIDPVSRSFQVEALLPPNSRYKPNMMAEIKVAAYTKPKAITVASGLIKHTPEGDIISVVNEGKVVNRVVNTGIIYNGRTEVLSGLYANDEIITSGGENLTQGEAVEVLNK